MSEKRCYTVKELQAILGVSRPSVYELLKRDVFRSFVVGGKHIISKSSFDEWLDEDSQAEERSQKVMDYFPEFAAFYFPESMVVLYNLRSRDFIPR